MVSSYLLFIANDDLSLMGEIAYQGLPSDVCFALDKNFIMTKATSLDGKTEYIFARASKIPRFYLDTANNRIYRNADVYIVTGCDFKNGLKLCFQSAYRSASDFKTEIPFNRISSSIISLDSLNITFYPLPIAKKTAEKLSADGSITSGTEEPLPISDPVLQVEGFEGYEIVNSFTYGEKKYVKNFIGLCPYKILAVNKAILCAKDGNITAYCLREKEKKLARLTAARARDILDWYNDHLFPDCRVKDERYFVSYDAKKCGGYNRGKSVELERFRNPKRPYGVYLLAHEIAHDWSITDPAAAWKEQMLAEGAADWCSLLYFESKGKFKRYHAYLSYRYFISGIHFSLYSIKNQALFPIHQRGYAFFDSIYRSFGAKGVLKCIRLFALAETKTAAGFLDNVKQHEGGKFYLFVKNKLNLYMK